MDETLDTAFEDGDDVADDGGRFSLKILLAGPAPELKAIDSGRVKAGDFWAEFTCKEKVMASK